MRYRDKFSLLADVVAAHILDLKNAGGKVPADLKMALEDTGYLPREYRGLSSVISTGLTPQQAAGVPANIPEWAIPLVQALTQPTALEVAIGSDPGSTDPAHMVVCICPAGRPDQITLGCPVHAEKN